MVGYGSVGRRHSRILTEFGLNVALVSKQGLSDHAVYPTIERALEQHKPDYVVISNETYLHYPALVTLNKHQYGGLILIEKPIFESTKPEIYAEKKHLIAVGYNLRFNPLLNSMRTILEQEKILSANIYVGQYLPNWRTIDYTNSYSAFEDRGGGVLRDLSHELDYCTWLFGDWVRLVSLGTKVSDLKIDGCDIYNILIQTHRCPSVNIQMSYLDVEPRRQIIVNTTTRTIFLDLINNILSINGHEESIALDSDFTYREMHRAIIGKKSGALCSFAEGLSTLRMIECIEESRDRNLWVSP